MIWTFSHKPIAEFSRVWEDSFWPPEHWINFPDLALVDAIYRWPDDDLPASQEFAKQITEDQLLLFAIISLINNIQNGGFSQALFNPSGALAEEAIFGFRKFGLNRYAEVFDEAWNRFGTRPVPRDPDQRIERLERLASFGVTGFSFSSVLEFASSIFKGNADKWDDLETEIYTLMSQNNKTDGYNSAFYRPLSEYIYANKEQFFVT